MGIELCKSRGTSKDKYLCTENITYAGVQRLSQYLKIQYNIKSSIHKAGNNYRIYISKVYIDSSYYALYA